MKYIAYKEEDGIAEMDIFCETSKDSHEIRAERLGVLDFIVAAGFLNFDSEGNVHCDGESNSLTRRLGRDIVSRGETDETLFRLHNRTSRRMA